MPVARRIPIFAANWKMNKAVADIAPYVKGLVDQLNHAPAKLGTGFKVVIAPPATHLAALAQMTGGSAVESSAQNCGTAKSGAFTGEISPAVLKELGVKWAVVGHSERRHLYHENDALVFSRMKAALEEGLSVIFCVGEKIEERRANQTFTVVERQLSVLKQLNAQLLPQIVIAYEPVWAIGTGENASPGQAQEVHSHIRNWTNQNLTQAFAQNVRVLYGGSVKPENAKDIMAEPDIDGFLVGGASLDATSFASVIKNGLLSRV